MTTPRLRTSVSSGEREGTGCRLRELTLPPLIRGPKGQLMEKPGSTAAHRHGHPHPHPQGSWGDKGPGGGEGSGGHHHTQYIRRLVDLRDELISQEETGLARALDRLRLHSINNRDAARYRLKIKEQASGDSPRMGLPSSPGTSYPRPMLTTVEKFRQMRPQRRPPIIFPLQGKQLIDSSPVSTGHTTRSSTEEGARADSSLQRGVEDTVKANLQRLIQPTSSIPNIGRKALRQESLELKSQSLQNMRNRVFKSTQAHLMSPFMMSHAGEEDAGSRLDSREEWAEGELQLSPHTYKLGPMTDGDRINMDKLNQYYYIYCMPDTPISGEGGGERRSLPPSLSSSTTPAQGQRRGVGGKAAGGGGGGGSKTSRRTSSERSHVSRPFSDRSSLSLVVSSDTELETSNNPRYKYPLDSVAMGTERRTLPIIHDSGEGSGSSPQRTHPGEAFVTQRDLSPDGLGSSSERRKRHIVIDMPHIIFNAATPDFAMEAGKAADSSHSMPLSDRPGVLSKTLKQNEIRHRELQNLLEDVKELNKRTETLSTQAQVTEMEASSSMLC